MQPTLEDRLEATKTEDPRQVYRDHLRALKDQDPSTFAELRAHYATEVEGALTSGHPDPLELWLRYGLVLARALAGDGHAVVIDDTGMATPLEDAPPPGKLTLFLPDGRGQRAVLVALPQDPSGPQQATLDLLVHGKVRLGT